MTDEGQGETEVLDEALKQVEHLGLGGHIEPGHDLVGQDEVGFQGDCPCYPDALALTAGQLVWIAGREMPGQANHVECFVDPALDVVESLKAQWPGNDTADTPARIE